MKQNIFQENPNKNLNAKYMIFTLYLPKETGNELNAFSLLDQIDAEFKESWREFLPIQWIQGKDFRIFSVQNMYDAENFMIFMMSKNLKITAFEIKTIIPAICYEKMQK